ncbi:MAG TPA: hypothetical protein VL947_03770 [Cytophagales bacterium]|nr:hypothetical protein [Cytophagales bacterium]
MNRRKFFKYAGIGAGAATIGGAVFYTTSTLKNLVTHILTEDLKGMQVTEQDIERFANDAAQINPWGYSDVKVKFIAAYGKIDWKWLNLPYKYKYQQYRADIVGRFLLSTNFFREGMDEQKKIVYSGTIYTPYNFPCYNPFSNMYYKS